MRYFSFILGIVFLLSMTSLATAGIRVSNESIFVSGIPGDSISGVVTLRLEGAALDGLVKTSAGQSISLRTLLERNNYRPLAHFNCSTTTCNLDYTPIQSITNGSMIGDSLVGFVIEGQNDIAVQEARFSLEGTSGASCYPSLGVDILNKGVYHMSNNRYIDEACSAPRYGCFEQDMPSQLVTLDNTPYCNSISLPIAPAFRVGVSVTRISQASTPLTLGIYDSTGTMFGECTVQAAPTGMAECIVNYTTVAQGDYRLCVRASTNGVYRLRAETNAVCGYRGFGSTPVADYELYAQDLKFNNARLDLTEQTFVGRSETSLSEYLSSYLTTTYDSRCMPRCVIPFLVYGGSQSITVRDPLLEYSSSVGSGIETRTLYSLEARNVTATSGNLVIDIAKANFTLPERMQRTFEITFEGTRITQQTTNNTNAFDFSVSPIVVAFGQETQFRVMGVSNVTSTSWTFGDETPSSQRSSSSLITHRYTREGSFIITVDVQRADGKHSIKRVPIFVGDAKTGVNITLRDYEANLQQFTRNISGLPDWQQRFISEQVGVTEITNTLRSVRTIYDGASNTTDYTSLLGELVSLRVPRSLQTPIRGSLPLLVGANAIDTYALEEMSESYDHDPEQLREAVVYWTTAYYNPMIEFTTYALDYGTFSEPLMTSFVVRSQVSESAPASSYLFLGYSSDQLIVPESVEINSVSGSIYIPMSDTLSFVVSGSVQPEELGAFIAPTIADLGNLAEPAARTCNQNNKCEKELGELVGSCSDCKPWGRALLLVVLVLAVGAGGYVALRWWYKNKYEQSLFKNKQDLANMIVFATLAHEQGLKETEIEKKLKGAGWKSEQIIYVLHKIKQPKPKTSPRKP